MKKITLLLALCSFMAVEAQSDPSWVDKQDLGYNLNARQDAGMVAIDNDLYILGGYANCGPKNLVQYNTQTAVITQLKNSGIACANPIYDGVLFTLGTKIYSFHGNGNNVYDLTTNEWTSFTTAAGLLPDAGFMIDNVIYITSKIGNVFYAFDTATNTFTQKADYPGTPNRRGAMSFDIAGKGYLAGGAVSGTNACTTEVGCFTSNVYEYDPVTDVWVTKANMPKAIVFGSAISHNGKGYAGLGEIYGGTVALGRLKSPFWYEYNPVTDGWTAMQNYMNLDTYFSTVAESSIAKINDEIYIFGGRSKGIYNIYQDNITKYNVTTNTWSSVNEDPGKNRTEAAGFYVNGKIYIGGGEDSEELTDFWEYDIATDAWTQKANLPYTHTQRACVELGGKGYFIGGYGKSVPSTVPNPNANYLNTVLEYDPATDVFTEKQPLPFKRSGMVAMVYDGKIYAGLGRNFNGVATATFNMYDPQTNTWTAKSSAPFTGENLSHFVIGNNGYVITYSPNPLIGKYNFETDTWTTVPNTIIGCGAFYSNQAFVFNGEAYLVACNSLLKMNTTDDTWSQVSNVPFTSQGNSIISTPTETYFGFGMGGETAGLGIHHSNMWSSLKFGADVSDAIGLYATSNSNFNGFDCNSGSLINGAKYAINDENGDLFMAMEAQPSAIISACMEVSSVALTTAFETDTANYGNGFVEEAMFLNKNLLLKNNNALGQGAKVRLYYTQTELQKLVTDFNAAYGVNKTISDIKIVRYFENGFLDHSVANNDLGIYLVLTSTLNNYGDDYYFEIDCSAVNTVTGEVRAALLTGQDLGTDDVTVSRLIIYPNPTNSILNIQTDLAIDAITITDISGRTTTVPSSAKNTIDVSTLSEGIYFVTVTTKDGFFREKFIKSH